jgi:general transcriptional corepressor CYC8
MTNSSKYGEAKSSYENVLQFNPSHAKVLQQLGWLFHQNSQFQSTDQAIIYLQKSVDTGKKETFLTPNRSF